ncbi:glycosyltransferase family 4 protein [Clostridium tepidum]|jgi:glycosyltransferase involved in cell wall biosynthesis|uniref:glycosyltransferase family 4 protein n=1 Tax=Clostridium tepidum TaxID=1962263 RepID=UPI00098F6557|nr:glycosyltransferase family 4 protein [Clostridium tepidum]MCR1935232.1 glycosyltransferase family 4 protein [Clostridium tepidum]MDU6878648.1 glycosyltransferase family 4 protein [Clostridium botulinum]
MKIKICHISTAHPTFDTRIYYKECRTIAKNEYDIYLLIANDKDEIVDDVKIVHLPKKNGRFYRFFKKRKIAFKKAVEIDADIYHFHDPELIPVGIKLKKLGKKVIYDVHEDVPKQILTKEWLKSDIIRKIVSNIFNKYEKKASNNFDKIVCVSEDIANNFDKNKTVIIRNFPVISDIDSIKPIDIEKKLPVVIYAGGLTKIRGIKEVIDAMELLNGKVKLWLLGKWENKNYEEECMRSKGWKYVEYFGLIPQKQAYSYMKKADIGIVNFWPVDNHISALPNKPFEYMACELPMIMSDFEYWNCVFKDCFLGIDPKNPEDISKKIQKLLHDKNLMKQLGQNGRNFVLKKYSWESEGKTLLNTYKELKNH